MEIQPLEMDKKQARQLWHEYKKGLGDNLSKDDEALKRGYQALAQGKTVISLFETMRTTGVDDTGRPNLAIVQAHAKRVYFRHPRWGCPTFTCNRDAFDRTNSVQLITLPAHTYPQRTFEDGTLHLNAVVPIIPPRYRPEKALEKYHILWDVDWEEPPEDPILLRALMPSCDLYAVVAQWDLTPLERTILACRN